MFSFFKPELNEKEKFTYDQDEIEIILEKMTYSFKEEKYIKLAFSLNISDNRPREFNVTIDISDKIKLSHLGAIEAEGGFYALTQAIKELPNLDPEVDYDWKSVIGSLETAEERYKKKFPERQSLEQEPERLRIGQ